MQPSYYLLDMYALYMTLISFVIILNRYGFVIVFKSSLRNFMRPSYYLLTCKLICSHVSSLRDLPTICWVLGNCINLTILPPACVVCYKLYLTLLLLLALYFRFIVITKDCLLKVRFPIIACVVCSFYIRFNYQGRFARGSISHYWLRCIVLYLL